MGISDQNEKLESRAKLASEKLPKYFAALERFLIENGSTGFYVGNKMTVADLAMWRMLGENLYILEYTLLSDMDQSFGFRPLAKDFCQSFG